MRTRALAAIALLAALGACSSSETQEPHDAPARFAVIAAPELGQDDTDLLEAVTKISREKTLSFVLVLGPLLGTDADASTLDALKNDLGQIAAPVYVTFASSAPVPSSAPVSKLKAEDILSAIETMGPGPQHKVSYVARIDRAKWLAVNALAPDGSGAAETLPEGTHHLLWFGSHVVAPEHLPPKATRPDVIVTTATGPSLVLAGHYPDEAVVPTEPVVVAVPRLSAKQYVVVRIDEFDVEVTPVALEGPSPPAPRPVVLPTIDRAKPPG